MKLNVRGFLTNNRSLKVISLIIAFIAWFVVVSSVSDDGRYPISDVPVDTEEFSTAVMAQLGLEAVDINDVTVDVVVEGKRYVIGNLTAEDIRIVPDLSAVREAGTYSIPLEATTTGSEEFDIVSIRPSTITVRFDRFASKRLEVEADVSGVSTSEGYLIENEIVSPQEIIITGPEADVSRVSRAVVTAEVDELLTSTYSVQSEIQLLDSDGNQITSRYISMDSEEAQVTIPILKIKEIPLVIDFINVPPNFSTEDLVFTIPNESILVAGPAESVDALNEIVLGYIDIKNLGINSVFVFNIDLPSGFVNIENIRTVQVALDMPDLVSVNFNLTDIRVVNVPAGYEAAVQTQQITGVEIIGPADVMESLSAGDMLAEIDLSEREITEGQFTASVKIYSPSGLPVWAKGNYEAIVSVRSVEE